MGRTVDAVSQVAQLLGVVQHLDALGVGVVAHREGSGDGGRKFPAAQTMILALFIYLFILHFVSIMDCWLSVPGPGFRLVSPHFLFGIFKALSHKVDGLVLCDWVLLQAGLAGVKGQHFGFVCQAVLSYKNKKTGTKFTFLFCVAPLIRGNTSLRRAKTQRIFFFFFQ